MGFFKTLHIFVSCMGLALAIAALYSLNKLTIDHAIPLNQRVTALENTPKDEVLEEVAACRKRAIEQTGVDTGYYKLCMDLVLDKRPANHHFYPASGE